jgi:transcriptional regulator with PAS, ATPase and Fis domain
VIHTQGARGKGPFIAINCAALPETLLESELFGYEKGAFTGADRRKPGRFELASGGTLFLDEIGELSPALQAKFLRVLQDKTFERLGGTGMIAADARIIAATNQDLAKRIAEGKFREDLFYRLHVYPIVLPSLRERKEDILPLAAHFLKKYSREIRKDILGLSQETQSLLYRYRWPGNIRELENIIERAVILCRGTVISAQDLPLCLQEHAYEPSGEGKALSVLGEGLSLGEVEKRCILQALEQTNYNRLQASKLLGLTRSQLRTRMRRYGLGEERQ